MKATGQHAVADPLRETTMHSCGQHGFTGQARQARGLFAWRSRVVAMALISTVQAVTAQASDASSDAVADSSVHFVVEVGSRLYTSWHETVRVHLLEEFFLADTDLTARVERFVPDFRISETGRIISQSDRLDNPAVHVVVLGDSATSDSTWAFLNFPPHFSPKSFFTFRLKEIEGYVPPNRSADPAIKREDVDG